MPKPEDVSADELIERAALEYAGEVREGMSSHPEVEELIAYQEGRLPSSASEEVRRHLVVCPACADELQRLDAFDQENEDEVQQDESPISAAQSWAKFQELVENEPPSPTARGPSWSGWMLAASILLALTGALAFFLTFQERQSDTETRLASANPFIVRLLPDGQAIQRNISGDQEVDVPPDMDLLVLQLLLGDQTPYADVSAQLTRSSGETVWRQSDLKRQPSGGFALLIPTSQTPSGRYVLRLTHRDTEDDQEIATYTFRIQHGE